MKKRDFSKWEEVSEDLIIFAAEHDEDQKDRENFKKLLKVAEIYRFANLTPIFLHNENTNMIACIAEELRIRET